MVFVDEELRDVEFHRPDFIVHVDFGEVVGTVQPLCGVNKGVRAAPGSCDIAAATQADYSSLYTALGVKSVRPHEGGYNISQLLVPPLSEEVPRSIKTVGGVGVRDRLEPVRPFDPVLDENFDETQLLPPFGFNIGDVTDDSCGGRNLATQDDADLEPLYENTLYFYWYPTLLNPLLFQLHAEQYLDLFSLGTEPGYRGLADAGLEIYFRLGEGSKGPGYIGDPDPAETESADARRCYAQLAARIVRDLAGGCSPATVPGFIDLWNEAFTGPFHAKDLDAQTDLPLWAADYASFFDEVHDALVSPEFPFAPFGAKVLPPANPGSSVDLSGVRFGGFSFLGGDMRRFADRMQGHPNLNSRVYELLSALDDPSRLSFLSFHLYGADDDVMEDGPFEIFDDLSNILTALDDFRAQQDASYDGLSYVHLSEWGYRLPKDDDEECASVFGGSFVASMLTWMQYAQTVHDLTVERAHLWGGSGRKTGIVSFGHLTRSDPPSLVEQYLFFIRASAIAMLFHSSVEGWELCMPRVIQGGSILVHLGSGLGVFDAAAQRLDITALAARSDVVMGASAYAVILSNLTEGSKRVRLELSGLAPNTRHSLVISRTNETVLGQRETYDIVDGKTDNNYIGHSVPADTTIPLDGIEYYALSADAVSAALADVVVEDHGEVVSDGLGNAVLDVEFPADHGVMKVHLVESGFEKEVSRETEDNTGRQTGSGEPSKDSWTASDSAMDDSWNVVTDDSTNDAKDEK